MAEVILKGKVIHIDDEDMHILSKYNWYINSSDNIRYYVVAKVYNKGKVTNIKLHRILLNPPRNLYIDHINGNGLDNRKSNLRVCTNQQNQRNARKKRTASSIYKGVSFVKARSKFRAYIVVNNKQTGLGQFSNEIDAAKAYDQKAKELFGEFAYLNFPEDKA